MSEEPRARPEAPAPGPSRYEESLGGGSIASLAVSVTGVLLGVLAGLQLAGMLGGLGSPRPGSWLFPSVAAAVIPGSWLITHRMPAWIRAPLLTGFSIGLGGPALLFALAKLSVL